LVKAYVWSTALYWSEMWIIGDAERRLETFKVCCYRRMMGKSWVDRVTNKVFGRIKKHNIVSKIFVMTHLSKRLTVCYLTTLYNVQSCLLGYTAV
jgi:hypothetical protein